MATALLRPQVNHLTCKVGRIGNDTTDTKREAHIDKLAVIVAEIIIKPHEEELVLVEGVERAEGCPEEELVCCKWESTSEQIARAFFNWNAEQGLRR